MFGQKRIIPWVLIMLLLLPAAAGLTRPETAFACDCAIPVHAAEALAENAAVFTGKVLAMKGTKWKGQYDEEYDAVLLEVDQIWKGIAQSQIIVYNPISSCQYGFDAGSSHLVYARANGGELVVSNCSRTVEISQAIADLSQLGPGEQPREQVNLLASFYTSQWLNGGVIAVVSIVLILLPIAVLVFRYRVRR